MENPHFLSSTSPSLLLTITFDCISEFKQRQMETLTIRTDFPSVPSADFSILPSPSTFFLSNNFPSPTFDQYPISATDYHQHFLPPAPEVANPEERAIQELPSLLPKHHLLTVIPWRTTLPRLPARSLRLLPAVLSLRT